MSMFLTTLMLLNLSFAQEHWDGASKWEVQNVQKKQRPQAQQPVAKQASHNSVSPAQADVSVRSTAQSSSEATDSRYTHYTPDQMKFCSDLHRSVSYETKVANYMCATKERMARIQLPVFKDCAQYMRQLDKEGKKGAQLLPLCFYYNLSSHMEKATQCLTDIIYTSGDRFWVIEDTQSFQAARRASTGNKYSDNDVPTAVIDETRWQPGFYMDLAYKQCVAPSNQVFLTRIKVIGEVNFPTYTSAINLPGERLGGLSGIVQTKPNELVAVSDDRGNPSIYTFRYELSQGANNNHIMFEYLDSQKIKTPEHYNIDLEDIALLPNGNFLVSSEVREGKSGKNALPDSYIFEVDKNLKGINPYELSEELTPALGLISFPCPVVRDSVKMPSDMDKYRTGTEDEDDRRNSLEAQRRQQTCTQKAITRGIYANKGLEAMAVDIQNNRFYYGAEQPTVNQPTIIIYQSELQAKPQKIQAKYNYPMTTGYDTGLVAMQVLNENTLLTMERGFDPYKKEAVVNIYKIDLHPARNAVTKELVVEVNNLKPQLAAGMHLIDNFEGMAIGPRLSNGNLVLFIVSDNNFKAIQKTAILALEIPKDLLDEK